MKEDGSEQDRRTIALIESIASQVRAAIERGLLPAIRTPTRSLENVTYNKEAGYLELGGKEQVRALTVNTARAFAQMLRLMAASRAMVAGNDFATKREAYYISKNWGDCRFDEQAESDAIMDDIEAMPRCMACRASSSASIPRSTAARSRGDLSIVDQRPRHRSRHRDRLRQARLGRLQHPALGRAPDASGRTRASFSPSRPAACSSACNNHRFWERANCILVEMGGVPTRATRRFVRLLSDRHDLPVYCFVDCDPYGFTNIYRTLKVGLRQRRTRQPLSLRAARAVSGRHAAGHRRFRA